MPKYKHPYNLTKYNQINLTVYVKRGLKKLSPSSALEMVAVRFSETSEFTYESTSKCRKTIQTHRHKQRMWREFS
jgi:hypothetical protein